MLTNLIVYENQKTESDGPYHTVEWEDSWERDFIIIGDTYGFPLIEPWEDVDNVIESVSAGIIWYELESYLGTMDIMIPESAERSFLTTFAQSENSRLQYNAKRCKIPALPDLSQELFRIMYQGGELKPIRAYELTYRGWEENK